MHCTGNHLSCISFTACKQCYLLASDATWFATLGKRNLIHSRLLRAKRLAKFRPVKRAMREGTTSSIFHRLQGFQWDTAPLRETVDIPRVRGAQIFFAGSFRRAFFCVVWRRDGRWLWMRDCVIIYTASVHAHIHQETRRERERERERERGTLLERYCAWTWIKHHPLDCETVPLRDVGWLAGSG